MIGRARGVVVGVVLALGVATLASAAAERDGPTAQERVDRIVERLDRAREENHAPGLAIGVVADGEVVLLRGLGLADVASEREVDADTRFAIGSTTKAMTAAAIGRLVDEGRMGWDDPVREHLPGFTLADADVAERVTIRDLLSHRAGLATLGTLWYGTDATEDQIIEALADAELLHPFREEFHYSNVSYLIAGRAAANAAGDRSWHELIRQWLLIPLGMAGATTRESAAIADPAQATGYAWDDGAGELEPLPLRRLDVIAPAGAINASAREMTRWLRMLLARGELGGERIVSETALEETWSPVIDAMGAHYGLGWFVSEWDGRRLLTHTGGIDGFSAKVAVLPDDGVAYVLLVNRGGSALVEASQGIVLDAMLGEWAGEWGGEGGDDGRAAGSGEDLARFTGKYIANFGQFSDAAFEVTVRDGTLAVDVPGQTVYELKGPDEDGIRPFAMTDQIRIRFNETARGEVYSMTLFQAGYELELPREGVEQPVDPVDVETVRPFLGTFRFDALGVDVEVRIDDGRLALDVPGQTVYELRDPDDEGRWRFKIRESIWVEFHEQGEHGKVDAITLVQDGHESVLPRVEAAAADPLPGVDTVMARMREARGGAALERVGALRLRGDVRLVHAGVRGSLDLRCTRAGQLQIETDLSPFGRSLAIATPERAWVDTPHARESVSGAAAEAIRLESPLAWMGDWRAIGDDVAIEGWGEIDGRRAIRVRVETEQLGPIEWLVDAETWLPAERRQTTPGAAGQRIGERIRYEDYRSVEGVMIAHEVTRENAFSGRTRIRYTDAEVNPPVGGAAFEIPGD